MTLQHDAERIPTGRQVRHLTDGIQNARAGRGLGSVLSDVWYAVVTVGLCTAFVTGIAQSLRDAAPDAGETTVALTGELPGALVAVAALGALLSLAGRLGPVGLGGGGAAWWLPMPIDRRGLLRPTVVRWPLVAAATGLVLVPLLVTMVGGTGSVGLVLRWAAFGAAVFGAAVAGAEVAQVHPRGSRWVAAAGEALLLVTALAFAAIALLGLATDGWALGAGWWAAVPLVLLAVAGTVVAERRTPELSGARLRAQGSLGDRAQVAVLSLDLRELGHALSASTGRARRRSVRLRAGGPRRAIVLADLMLLVRSPRPLVQIVVATLFAVAAGKIALTSGGLALYGVWLLTGFWAASSAAGGARQADMAPVLDRLLPLSARDARLVRGVVPLLAAVVWAVPTFAVHASRTGETGWLLVAPAWALVVAAAAVRAAYRPAPRWTASTVSSPMGGVPPTGGMFKGLDVALVGTLPTAVAAFLGGMPDALPNIQHLWALTVAAVLAAASGRRRKRT